MIGRARCTGVPSAEQGTALVLTIVLVLAISAIALALSATTRTETLVAANFRQGREALYAAEGILGIAMRDLAAMPDWDAALSGAAASSFTDGASIGTRRLPGGGSVSLCCGRPSLTDDVQQRALGGRDWGNDTPQWQLFAWGPVSGWLPAGQIDSAYYVAAWVADDPEDGDGNPAADTNGIVLLYAQALGPRDGRRIVQASVGRQRIGEDAAPGPGVRLLSWQEIRW